MEHIMNNLLSASQWQQYFKLDVCQKYFLAIYGTHDKLIHERRQAYLTALSTFQDNFGSNRDLFFVRIPARINLMGVHIEHRGGFVNYMTIAKEMLMAVAPRTDNVIRFANVESKYSSFKFTFCDEFPADQKTDWLEYLNKVQITKGKWENYVKGASYYLQNYYNRRLSGMDVVVFGKIPAGAGLSSSSALVVGTFEAINYINQLNLTPEQKSVMSGEAEWYVGTRGGAGDHAAIIYGRKNHIAHLQFFPVRVEMIPMPETVTVVACNSMVMAKKAAGAKDIFNERVAAYEIAFMLLKHYYPHFKNVNHLRDYNQKNLDINLTGLYEIIKALPLQMTRKEVLANLPHEKTRLDTLFSTHREPEKGYQIRAVCLFGLSECARSEMTGGLLHQQDLTTLGQIMYISHDGDRLVTTDDSGNADPFEKNFHDSYFNRQISSLSSANAKIRNSAKLVFQPGGYNCSTHEMDFLVDIARRVEGVYGASLTGGGLGGMVLVLIERESVPQLFRTLDEKYYRPRDLPFSAEECISIDGVSILDAAIS